MKTAETSHPVLEENGIEVGDWFIDFVCPECQMPYSHVYTVRMEPTPGRPEPTIIFEVQSECSHDWEIRFFNHRGATRVETVRMPSTPQASKEPARRSGNAMSMTWAADW